MGIFSEREVKYLGITILILTLIFGFNDNASIFEISHWINNFVLVFIAVTISFLAAHFVHKFVAKKHFAISKYELWNLNRFGFAPHMRTKIMKREFAIPAGIIFPLLVSIMSNGLWYFPLVGTYEIIEGSVKRTGKIFNKLSGYERAIIYLSSPLTNLVLFFMFLFLERTTGINFSIFITVNMWMALFALLPIPGLMGAEILFGSLPFYLFSVVLFSVSAIIAPLSIWIAILLALILSSVVVLTYFIGVSK